MTITLRPDQQRVVDNVRAAFRRHRAVLLQAGCGFGKTHTAAYILGSALAKGNRAIFLAHLHELLHDTHTRLAEVGLPVGRLQAGHDPDPEAPLQVASIQTMNARGLSPDADLIVIDEAHHAVASTIKALLDRCPKAKILGLSATPARGDGAALGSVFDVMVEGPSILELQQLGVLVPVDVYAPPMTQDKLAMSPSAAIARWGAGKKSIVFCVNRAASKATVAELEALGIKAAHLDGTTPKRVREETIARFAAGDLDALCNVALLVEGFNVPSVDVVVLARGFSSVTAFMQAAGRGMRSSPGKTHCVLVDLRGAVRVHGLPDEDRKWSLHGSAASVRTSAVKFKACPKCFMPCKTTARACERAGCGYAWPEAELPDVEAAELSAIDTEAMRQHRARARVDFESIAIDGRLRGWKPIAIGLHFKKRWGWFPREWMRAAGLYAANDSTAAAAE